MTSELFLVTVNGSMITLDLVKEEQLLQVMLISSPSLLSGTEHFASTAGYDKGRLNLKCWSTFY